MNKDFRANLLSLKQYAFTLAETLVVIGIIGVVAALTLPNLNSSTGEKEKVVKLQKIYSNLQDAFGRAEVVYGPFKNWCSNYDGNCNKRVFERITEFMKYTKVCTISDNCQFTLNSGSNTVGKSTKYSIILSDGTVLDFELETNTYLHINIDIDGINKGANKSCMDNFEIEVNNTQGLHYTYTRASYIDHSTSCAAWVLVNGNMDYLKVGNDGKCPDGKTVLDWTTNTTCK